MRKRKPQSLPARFRFPLMQMLPGLDLKTARTLAVLRIKTLEDLRDADLDAVLEHAGGLEYPLLQRWQQQALLQTVFAGMSPKQAKILVDAGITSIEKMAHAEVSQLNKAIAENHLRAWKFIAAHIPANVLPEHLETTQQIEALAPPQAVALYAQGIKTLQNLREVRASDLDFDFLPTINKRGLALWQDLARMRIDYGIGPAYAHELHIRYAGNEERIRRHLERERSKALSKISKPQPGGIRGAYSLKRRDAGSIAASPLEPICRNLIAGRNRQQNKTTLKQAKRWGSSFEIAGELLNQVAEDPNLDKGTVISWITENKLATRRGLLDLIPEIVRSEAGKKNLIEALPEQWGLSSVLNLLNDSARKDSLWHLFLEGGKFEAGDLPKLLKFTEFARDVVNKMLDESGIAPAKLISAVLQSPDGQKEPRLQTLLNCLNEKQGLDKMAAVLSLYEENADLLHPFLKNLYQLGMASWDKLDELLQIPLQAFGKESQQDRDGVFVAIFKAISAAGIETDADLEAMTSNLLNWVRQANQQESVPLVDWGVNSSEEMGAVPLGVHLLGEGIKSVAGKGYQNLPEVDRLIDKLFQRLQSKGELEEEIWLHLIKIPGMLFLLFPKMLLKAITTPMKVFQWIGQDANNICQKDRKLDIRTLPPPDDEHKYAIISDMHRDAPEDVVDEYFFDLSHFSKNRDLFITALEYYLNNGYIVIENGDCEELWVVPSVKKNKGVKERALRIIDPTGPNRRVYELLAELHRQGRYFRTRGNHDDFWTQSPENEKLLKDTWFREGPHEFKIWDGLIIPEVLTMYDDYLGVMKKIALAKLEKKPLDVDELVDLFPVGLSPHRYRERRPLLIIHGHQTDFWNCDEHNFLGKTLANSIGIIADGMTTFPFHLRGIDLAGTPIVEFTKLLTAIPQVNNWLPEDVAKTLSRNIEQSKFVDRRTQDGIAYFETLTAALSLALRYPGQKGLLPLQILAGHTHWPQSRPPVYLGMLTIPLTDKTIPLRLPTQYYNSGTCGWWEGVLWGIEVTALGQAKLFYWERNLTEPHYMQWELHGDIPEYVIRYKQKIKKFLERYFPTLPMIEEHTQNLTTWEEIDDFSELHRIDLSTLTPVRQAAALSTAQVWALRLMLGRPKTSGTLELIVALDGLGITDELPPKLSLVPAAVSNPGLFADALEALKIGGDWTLLNSQHERYFQVGSLFFYAAQVLRNRLCYQLGLLINLFISQEKAFLVRFEKNSRRFVIKLGNIASEGGIQK